MGKRKKKISDKTKINIEVKSPAKEPKPSTSKIDKPRKIRYCSKSDDSFAKNDAKGKVGAESKSNNLLQELDEIISISSGECFQDTNRASQNNGTAIKRTYNLRHAKLKEFYSNITKEEYIKQTDKILKSPSPAKNGKYVVVPSQRTTAKSDRVNLAKQLKVVKRKQANVENNVLVNKSNFVQQVNQTIERKIGNSTNLKRLSKSHLEISNQSKLTDYFRLSKNPDSIGFFETFDVSEQQVNVANQKSAVAGNSVNNNENVSTVTKRKLPQKPKKTDVPMRVADAVGPSLSVKTIKIRSVKKINRMPFDSNSNFLIEKDKNHSGNDICGSLAACCSSNSNILHPANTNISTRLKKSTNPKTVKSAERVPKIRKTAICPDYKIVQNTTFAVDAFRYGHINGITDYFLTHFHADHYIGLQKSFDKPLYLSRITGRLVEKFIQIKPEFLRLMDINTEIQLKGVRIVALDANHCPGAVMFLFHLDNGKNILHTGDFRANADMESYAEFWNCDIDTVYLDTTYLNKSYDFQAQSDSLDDAVFECDKFIKKCAALQIKFLIVVGAYVIGKERVWHKIAQYFDLKVWLEPNRRKAVDCIFSEENSETSFTQRLVDDPRDANVHVLGLRNLNYFYLAEYLKHYDGYNLLAIKPSGWEKNSKPSYGNRISIVGIEYSEHSSYNEMKRFIRFLQPKNVISTVPKSSKDLNCTSSVPLNWLDGKCEPQATRYQPSITNYLKLHSKKIDPPVNNDVSVILIQNEIETHSISSSEADTDYMA